MRQFLSSLLISFFVILICCIQSKALVGQVDVNDEFPYVVQIDMQYKNGQQTSCSGVAYGFILSTAAHCLYDDDQGLATRVTVHYIDAANQPQTAHSRSLYVPSEYIRTAKQYTHDFRGALHDVGYVVLDRELLLKGYIHWGLELLKGIPNGSGNCANRACADWTLTGPRREAFLANLREQVGDLNHAKIRVIGYGNFTCADFHDRENRCHSDGKRRFVDLDLVANFEAESAPWVWCTGLSEAAATNPIQHGDSGGPTFVQALDGRWLYVGYVSRGNDSNGCSSSIFSELNLWRDASSAAEVGQGDHVGGYEIIPWQKIVATQFFSEWIRNTNQNNDLAVRAFKPMYGAAGTIAYYGRHMSSNEIMEQKQRFFERWPDRRYELVGPVDARCVDGPTGENTCTIWTQISWTIQDSGQTRQHTDELAFILNMPGHSQKSLLQLDLVPTVAAENGDHDSIVRDLMDAQGPSSVENRIKLDVSGGYVNLRAGPGQNQRVIDRIPAGETVFVTPEKCQSPTDGVSRFPFCPVSWKGRNGWVSGSSLE
jgi:hypothetical protein